MVKKIFKLSCVCFSAILLFSCQTAKIQWKPIVINEPKFIDTISKAEIDNNLLADLVTFSFYKNNPTAEPNPFWPYETPIIARNPYYGPFLFSNGEDIVVVADEKVTQQEYLIDIAANSGNHSIYKMHPDFAVTSNCPGVSNKIDTLVYGNVKLTNKTATNGERVVLTPENIAEQLSAFSLWDGVHIDSINGEMYFFGHNDGKNNPPITRNDIVTAYRAIFDHEAAGEPLFVDMDFSKKSEEQYLVTFGGGFEDTHIGKVLLDADVLLKAMSTGVDPWTNTEPLVCEMCISKNQSNFQKAFCILFNYIINENIKFKDINEQVYDIYNESIKEKKLIKKFTDAPITFRYLLKASNPKKDSILKESKNDKLEFPFQTPSGELKKVTCSGDSLYFYCKRIFELSPISKGILLKAINAFPNASDASSRLLYVTLAFCFEKSLSFLNQISQKNLSNTFNILNKLYEGNDEGIIAQLAMIYFMSENKEFSGLFFQLDEDDQLILAYLTAYMIKDPDFFQFIENLQYYQPLCKGSDLPEEVTSMQEAYIKFVCKHLSQYKRTYLADLVRTELKKINPSCKYMTAEEIRDKYDLQMEKGWHTTRFWFYPGNEALQISTDLNTFIFQQPQMEARAEKLDQRRGPFESVKYEDSEAIPGVDQNLKIINKYYNDLSELFPTLKELSNVVRLLTFFRWIRYYHPDNFDLTAFINAVNYNTPTPRKYPLYETAIALPNGTMLRAKGGIDLHSCTNVRFNDQRTDSLRTSFSIATSSGNFNFESKKMKLSKLFSPENANKASSIQYLCEENNLILKSENGQYVSAYAHKDTLKTIVCRKENVFGEIAVSKVLVKNKSTVREEWINGAMTKEWKLETNNNFNYWTLTNTLHEKNMKSNLENVKSHLMDALDAQLPFDVLWSDIASAYPNARLIQANDKIILSIATDSSKNSEITLCGTRNNTGYIVNEITEDELNKTIKTIQNDQQIYPGCKVINLQICRDKDDASETDVMEKGINYTVKLNSSKDTETYDMNKWSNFIAGNYNLKISLIEKEKNKKMFVMKSSYKIKTSGIYDFPEYAQREFMVKSCAALRSLYQKQNKDVVISRDFSGNGEKGFSISDFVPQKRFLIVDTSNFNDNQIGQIHELIKNNTGRGFIFNYSRFCPYKTEPNCEVIWLTILSESEVQNYIEMALKAGWFKNIKRLRVMNIGNPIQDLGTFIFSEDIKAVGAWPHYVDFETAFPLIENLFSSKSINQIDKQIALAIETIRSNYKKNPTPIKLQINRNLPELLKTWEEVSLQNNTKRWEITKNK